MLIVWAMMSAEENHSRTTAWRPPGHGVRAIPLFAIPMDSSSGSPSLSTIALAAMAVVLAGTTAAAWRFRNQANEVQNNLEGPTAFHLLPFDMICILIIHFFLSILGESGGRRESFSIFPTSSFHFPSPAELFRSALVRQQYMINFSNILLIYLTHWIPRCAVGRRSTVVESSSIYFDHLIPHMFNL